MKYMALIFIDPETMPAMGEKMNADYMEFTRRAREAGVMAGGDALQPAAAATTLRVRGGRTETMDGPFAVTKEQLAGYYVFDCADLDAALKWAAEIPGARHGSVELRPIRTFA